MADRAWKTDVVAVDVEKGSVETQLAVSFSSSVPPGVGDGWRTHQREHFVRRMMRESISRGIQTATKPHRIRAPRTCTDWSSASGLRHCRVENWSVHIVRPMHGALWGLTTHLGGELIEAGADEYNLHI